MYRAAMKENYRAEKHPRCNFTVRIAKRGKEKRNKRIQITSCLRVQSRNNMKVKYLDTSVIPFDFIALPAVGAVKEWARMCACQHTR